MSIMTVDMKQNKKTLERAQYGLEMRLLLLVLCFPFVNFQLFLLWLQL